MVVEAAFGRKRSGRDGGEIVDILYPVIGGP